MKYGRFVFTLDDVPTRSSPVDWDNLPEKCCAKCDHWVRCSERAHQNPKKEIPQDYGLCCGPEQDNEWDYFSFADDCCLDFEVYDAGGEL